MSKPNFAYYIVACRADDEYQRELRRVYGAAALVARYRQHHDDIRVEAAMRVKLAADEAWRREQRRALEEE